MIDLDEKKNAFTVSYVDGALRVECSPDATLHTLQLLKQSFVNLMQIVGRGLRHDRDGQDAASPSPLPSTLDQAGAVVLAASEHAAVAKAPLPTALSASPPSAPQPTQLWLSDAIEQWRVDGGGTFSENSWIDSYEPTFRTFRELVGNVRRSDPDAAPEMVGKLDIPVQSLTREHIAFFFEMLKVLPPRQGKRDKTEALERIMTAQMAPQQASAPGVVKKLRHIAPCLGWFELKSYISADLLKELQLAQKAGKKGGAKGSSKKRKQGYVAFSLQELKAIFEQPGFLAAAVRADWAYWVPLLCLYNGLRVAEASQLHTGDFCLVDSVPCLRTVTIDVDDDGNALDQGTATMEEHLRRLKNDASRRTVPVHPRLIELGLLDFVAQIAAGSSDSKHLFSTLKWQRKSLWGRRPSEVMGDLIRSAGAYQFRRKVPHSLRSNFNQEVEKTGLPDSLIQRLMGHATGKMKDESYAEADYGMAFPAALALPYLQKADFGLNVRTWAQIVELRAQPRPKRDARPGIGDKCSNSAPSAHADPEHLARDGTGTATVTGPCESSNIAESEEQA